MAYVSRMHIACTCTRACLPPGLPLYSICESHASGAPAVHTSAPGLWSLHSRCEACCEACCEAADVHQPVGMPSHHQRQIGMSCCTDDGIPVADAGRWQSRLRAVQPAVRVRPDGRGRWAGLYRWWADLRSSAEAWQGPRRPAVAHAPDELPRAAPPRSQSRDTCTRHQHHRCGGHVRGRAEHHVAACPYLTHHILYLAAHC